MREQDPFRTAMSAITRKLVTSNSLLASMLNDSGTKDSLDQAHRATTREFGHWLEEAKLDPSPRNLDLFYDYLAVGALNIRASVSRTSALGELQQDAMLLNNYVTTVPIASEMDYVSHVDQAFSMNQQLQGEAMVHQMQKNGMLTQLLPTFVSRLDPRLRDRALEFWNGVAHAWKKDGPFRDNLPAYLRARIDAHLTLHREVNQLSPALERLEAFDRQPAAVGMLAVAARELENDANAASVRMLHVAADLHWVAPAGILATYWRTFVRTLQGGYTRSVCTPPSELFELSTSELGNGPTKSYSDDDLQNFGAHATDLEHASAIQGGASWSRA